jgi:hypothetical protein
MANTITNSVLLAGSKEAVIYITLASDGTNETATVIYDSSAIATTVGDNDTLDCTIIDIYGAASAASTARVNLLFDATTDLNAFNIPVGSPSKANFRKIGGLPNKAGTGKTGDILLTTTGLAAGDSIILVITVRRN